MRLPLAATCLFLCAGVAPASPLPADPAPAWPVTSVHHKPWHEGGPPWARRGRDEREDRGFARDDEDDDRRSLRARRVECVTRYQERYDPYRDAYVRRPVEVCEGREADRYGYR